MSLVFYMKFNSSSLGRTVSSPSNSPSIPFLFPRRYFWNLPFSCSNLDWIIYRPVAWLLTLIFLHHPFEKSLYLCCEGLPVTWFRVFFLISFLVSMVYILQKLPKKGAWEVNIFLRFLHVQIDNFTHTLDL